MNASIAAGLLWHVFGNKPNQSTMLKQPSAEQVPDDILWERAESEKSAREAFFHLSQIEDTDGLKTRAAQEIETLLSGDQPGLDRWPFLQALLQKYGGIALNGEELMPLAQITSNIDQPITLRDTAFRSYVENFLRLKVVAPHEETPFSLTDLLFKEDNSLPETALQAEYFLEKNGVTFPGQRLPTFEARLKAVLEDRQRAESIRITAFNILSERGSAPDLPLDTLYQGAGVRLQTAILQALASSDASEETTRWLEDFQPRTPEQEQLRLRIIGQ